MLSGLLVAALLLQYAAADTLGGYSATFVTSLRQRLSLKHKIGQMVQLNLAMLLNHDQLTLNSTTCAPSPHPPQMITPSATLMSFTRRACAQRSAACVVVGG